MEKAKGKILSPVDLSAASEVSARYALEMARELDARIVFLYVEPENSLSSMIVFPKFLVDDQNREWSKSKRERAHEKLTAFLESFDLQGVRHETRVEKGVPYTQILRVAEGMRPDVVVQGTHGTKGMEDRIIGGTAERVIRKAICPVISVKPKEFGSFLRKIGAGVGLLEDLLQRPEGPRELYPFPPKRILYATDFSEAAKLALKPAVNLAHLSLAELIVLNVSREDPGTPGDRSAEAPEQRKGPTAWEQMGDLVRQMSAYYEQVIIDPRILKGESTSKIVSFAVREDIDLIVMGTRGPTGWEQMLTGSTALSAVHNAPCPVLTVRPNWKREELERKFSRVFRRLGPMDLQRMSSEHQTQIEEDLLGKPGEMKKSEFFLNTYSREGMLTAFEEYGILERLRQDGFDGFLISFNLDDPFRHKMRLYHGDEKGADHLLMELVLHEGNCQLPGAVEDSGGTGGKHCQVLIIEWILMQNPRDPFSPDRPPLPGQEHPGLGVGYEVYEFLVRVGMRMKKEGLMNRPQHYHNAKLYHERFKFLDPVREGRLIAMIRDTGDYNLWDVSWAIYHGCLIDEETKEIPQWEGGIMVYPMTERLERYLASAHYRDTVWDTVANSHFHIDWDLFQRRMDADGKISETVRAHPALGEPS